MDPLDPMLSDDDSDEEFEGGLPPGQRGRPVANPNRAPLQHFLRLIAGGRMGMVDHGRARSNEELVAALRAGGIIHSQAVAKAMQVCARDVFVVERYRDEAFFDSPIRVEAMEFNISAPHMHATCLEALNLHPGAAVLDVGAGCGVITACAAFIVGKSGRVVGIDVRRDCVQLSRQNIARLAETSPEYAATACAATVEIGNCFITAGTAHRGCYDCVHVGASCPPSALQPLLQLLKPQGGTMVVPVAPSDLRVIVKKPNGAISQRIISQVRFSELEVPGDGEVVLASLRQERKARTAPPLVASSFEGDARAILEKARWKGKGAKCELSSSPTDVISGLPPSPTSCAALSPEVLGPPDCVIVGSDWEIPVHSAVLRQRCDQFRARCGSGMRDAELSRVDAPPHFSHEALAALVRYLYTDGTAGVDCHSAAEVLHVAQYYGVARLAHLCEVELAKVLKGAGKSNKALAVALEAAGELLAFAHDQGLAHLRAVAADFIVAHYPGVEATEGFAALSRDQVAVVAAEACRLLTATKAQLQEVMKASQEGLPDP